MLVISLCSYNSMSERAIKALAENHDQLVLLDVNCGCRDCKSRNKEQKVPLGHEFKE